ncbi:AAA family ATPase [Maridesulfovibrio sp.]|uniref:AAA family ATPase n=1 Tax=Maridesulfovibrio sp. TaxID=2795000 RepID=UPI002A1874FC|nr:AAA family ATPase [Maridesulfovibrio sp.]
MIKKIILKDFLAHGETEIELGEGMTVLTGLNNSGKSSVVEALRCIATNPLPRHFIRHGASRARVELEMDDGVRVAWIRKKATAWYEVMKPGQEEPEVYAKFGRKPPEDVLNLLRLNHVPLENGNSLDVHIGNQRNPIFLLDQPPSVAAQFFASSSEASHLLAMQTELKNRVRNAKRDQSYQQKKMESIRAELDRMQELPDVCLELESARELKTRTETIEKEIPAIEALLQRKNELETNKRKLAEREKSLNGLLPAPELFPSAQLENTVARMNGLSSTRSALERKSTALEGLRLPPDLFPAAQLAESLARQHRLRNAGSIQSARRDVLKQLSPPPEPEDLSAISATISNISRNRVFRDRIAGRSQILGTLAAPPELFDISQLGQLLDRISSLSQEMTNTRKRIADLKQAEERMKERISARLTEIGNCPLCGGELDADKLIGEDGHGA